MGGEFGGEGVGSRKVVLLERFWMFSGVRYNPDALTLPLQNPRIPSKSVTKIKKCEEMSSAQMKEKNAQLSNGLEIVPGFCLDKQVK